MLATASWKIITPVFIFSGFYVKDRIKLCRTVKEQ